MKKIKRIVAICLSTSLIACGGNPETEEESTVNHDEEIEVIDEGMASGDSQDEEAIEMEDVKRWKANPETTDGINRMIALVEETSGSQYQLDYEILHEKLQIEFKNIFEKCTMEGEAHEALHDFLFPMKAYFEGIGSDDLVTCQENLNSLEKHLSTYEYKFE